MSRSISRSAPGDDAGSSLSRRRRGAVSGHTRSAAHGTPAVMRNGEAVVPTSGRLRVTGWTNVRIAAGRTGEFYLEGVPPAASTPSSTTSRARARSRCACRRRPRQSCSWGRSMRGELIAVRIVSVRRARGPDGLSRGRAPRPHAHLGFGHQLRHLQRVLRHAGRSTGTVTSIARTRQQRVGDLQHRRERDVCRTHDEKRCRGTLCTTSSPKQPTTVVGDGTSAWCTSSAPIRGIRQNDHALWPDSRPAGRVHRVVHRHGPRVRQFLTCLEVGAQSWRCAGLRLIY